MPRSVPAAALTLALCGSCTGPPPPTAGARQLAQNPRASVEGRVIDADGRPVEGVRVQAVPGGRDIVWSPDVPTDADGRFRLSLDAPAEYVFLIFEERIAVLTPSPRDPSQVRIFVNAGETKRGVELTLLRKERRELLEPPR